MEEYFSDTLSAVIMKHTIFILLFSVALITYSCSVIKTNSNENQFEKRIKKYSTQKNIAFIDFENKTQDTLTLIADSFKKDFIEIVLPGPNTLNFASLYYLNNNISIRLDSSACWANQFLKIKITPKKTGEYLIKNHGCHYARNIVVLVK